MDKDSVKPFAYDLDEADIKRERCKARELRASQWWKRRCAKGVCYYCNVYVQDWTVRALRISRAMNGPRAP